MKLKSIYLLIFILLLSACNLDFSLSTEVKNVNDLAAEITEFDLPTGFTPEFSSTFMGYQAVGYSRGSGPGHIYLIQSEDPADSDTLESALDEMVIRSGDPFTEIEVIENRTVTIRGQESTLVISDAINAEGETYRQAMVGFDGDGGPALLVYSEALNQWSDETLLKMIASIH